MLKRVHKGVFHYISLKHLHRYVAELAFRHNILGLSDMTKMEKIVSAMIGKRLTYKELTR